MIGQSQSGTGKTAAFVLTMLSRIDYSVPSPQAICIAPTRELAAQIMLVVDKMGQYTPVTKFFASKGASFAKGEKVEKQLLVGTVGTFLDVSRCARGSGARETRSLWAGVTLPIRGCSAP